MKMIYHSLKPAQKLIVLKMFQRNSFFIYGILLFSNLYLTLITKDNIHLFSALIFSYIWFISWFLFTTLIWEQEDKIKNQK